MINCVFLSRDFPFTWFLDDFKDVLSWPDERKSKFLMMKPIYYETLQQNECCNLCCIGNCKWTWLQKYRGMQQMLKFPWKSHLFQCRSANNSRVSRWATKRRR